jgi:hypothetical protein
MAREFHLVGTGAMILLGFSVEKSIYQYFLHLKLCNPKVTSGIGNSFF